MKGGPLLASATTINVTIRGIGGHGSAPQAGKDPIVLAAEFVLVAQTIVSRQVDPQQPAVLTVGTIHGGTKNNIIPDEVTMGLTLRTYSVAVRDQIIADRAPHREGTGGSLRHSRRPHADGDFEVRARPLPYNDPALAERLRALRCAALGKERVVDARTL